MLLQNLLRPKNRIWSFCHVSQTRSIKSLFSVIWVTILQDTHQIITITVMNIWVIVCPWPSPLPVLHDKGLFPWLTFEAEKTWTKPKTKSSGAVAARCDSWATNWVSAGTTAGKAATPCVIWLPPPRCKSRQKLARILISAGQIQTGEVAKWRGECERLRYRRTISSQWRNPTKIFWGGVGRRLWMIWTWQMCWTTSCRRRWSTRSRWRRSCRGRHELQGFVVCWTYSSNEVLIPGHTTFPVIYVR